MKKVWEVWKTAYGEFGKIPRLLLHLSLSCMLACVLGALLCRALMFGESDNTLLSVSEGLLVSARSCLGVGALGVFLALTAERSQK